jgi:hypothetical protein
MEGNMENETKTVEQETTAAEPEKTFTQTELNAIVSDRLKRDREKYADYNDIKAKAEKYDAAEEESKTELQKATERAEALQSQIESMTAKDQIRQAREKVAAEMNVPANLLSATDEEACKTQAQAILDFAKPTYPAVKDGGEPHKGTMSKDEILKIQDDKTRIKAIEENIDLF